MTVGGNSAEGFGHLGVMPRSDASLWAEARSGDPDAFALLFRRHGKAIYNYLFRSTGDWATAEDLVSTVFLEAWRRRDTELAEGYVLPWLYGIAVNVLRNRRRSERRFISAFRRLPRPETEPDFSETAAERVDDERQMQQALVLLRRLPARERDVFVLCAWMGLSYDGAAIALDLPIGTVRSRLSRARVRIRELDRAGGHLDSGADVAEP